MAPIYSFAVLFQWRSPRKWPVLFWRPQSSSHPASARWKLGSAWSIITGPRYQYAYADWSSSQKMGDVRGRPATNEATQRAAISRLERYGDMETDLASPAAPILDFPASAPLSSSPPTENISSPAADFIVSGVSALCVGRHDGKWGYGLWSRWGPASPAQSQHP